MHNTTRFKATFSGLIITAFEKEQTLKIRLTLTMYQASSSPERWTFTPTLPTGRPHLEASTPQALAMLIEDNFVTRETEWMPTRADAPRIGRSLPANVVAIDQKRRA